MLMIFLRLCAYCITNLSLNEGIALLAMTMGEGGCFGLRPRNDNVSRDIRKEQAAIGEANRCLFLLLFACGHCHCEERSDEATCELNTTDSMLSNLKFILILMGGALYGKNFSFQHIKQRNSPFIIIRIFLP
jgi:hypothetical protein